MRPTVKTSGSDDSKKLRDALAKLQKAQVYVGIPEEKTQRNSGQVTNAQLMYIHTNGSPLNHIPARPVIEPAIAAPDNRSRITTELGAAATSLMDGDATLTHQHLEKAGMQGRNAAIRWFDDPANGWPGNSPLTISRKGSSKPLIDTGQLRRNITYVVDDGK